MDLIVALPSFPAGIVYRMYPKTLLSFSSPGRITAMLASVAKELEYSICWGLTTLSEGPDRTVCVTVLLERVLKVIVPPGATGSLPAPIFSSVKEVSLRTLSSSSAFFPDHRISAISESGEMVPENLRMVPALGVREVKTFLTPRVSKT